LSKERHSEPDYFRSRLRAIGFVNLEIPPPQSLMLIKVEKTIRLINWFLTRGILNEKTVKRSVLLTIGGRYEIVGDCGLFS